MKPHRVYIAGPMSQMPAFNRPAFNTAAGLLRQMGFHVENPAEIPAIEGDPWSTYMRWAITKMLTCEAVVLLPGWQGSKGANIERNLAIDLGIEVWEFADFVEAMSA